MTRILALALSMAAVVASGALAAADAKKAPQKGGAPVVVESTETEAVTMFRRICVETKGDIDSVRTRLAELEKQALAKTLSGEEARKATGHDTVAAWAMQSPVSKQKLLASEDKDGSCNLFVERAGDAAIREEFKRLAVWLAIGLKSKLGVKSKEEDGLHYDYYEVLTEDKSARPFFILAGAKTPKGTSSYLLTYKTVTSTVDAPK